MARVALNWTVHQLAEKADVMPNTVSNFERGRGAHINTAKALKLALLSSGKVRFEGESCVCVDEEDI